jgi:p21-activated kinase 1
MDSQGTHSNGSSQRRKLTKKPPSHHYTRSSSGLDGGFGFDAQSLQSKRSSQSLKRAPSAPGARTTPSNASNNSSPRHPPSTQRSNPSPLLVQGEFSPASPPYSNHAAAVAHPLVPLPTVLPDPHVAQQPLISKPSDDFIGAPFDGAAILNRLDAGNLPNLVPAPSTLHRPNVPPPLTHAATEPRALAPLPSGASPALRQSASFMSPLPTMSEKSQGNRTSDNAILSPKRLSDETKEPRTAVLRKKSGFSGFVSGLVGSPKKPIISAPENPVHVTHVGYDSATGQFTVCSRVRHVHLQWHRD